MEKTKYSYILREIKKRKPKSKKKSNHFYRIKEKKRNIFCVQNEFIELVLNIKYNIFCNKPI